MTSIADNVFGIVLAGGKSRRFGTSKTLTQVGGLSLASRPISTLKGRGAFCRSHFI